MGRHPLKPLEVIGWYGKGNVGDEAYKLAFPTLFPNRRVSFSTFFKPEAADTYIVGGGDCLNQDLLTKLTKYSARKLLMSVAVSNVYPAELLSQFERIIVRDSASLERVEKAGLKATLCPDFTFALTPDPGKGRAYIRQAFAAEKRPLSEKVVVVVVNGHLIHDQDSRKANAFEKLAYDLSYIADWTDASFLFMPFGTNVPWDDRVANAYVGSKPKWYKKNLTLYDRFDPQSALDIIAGADAVISSRLHSSIFATVAGVPFVDVTHNHKNPEFLKGVGLSEWAVPFMTFDAERARSLLHGHLTSAETKVTLQATTNQHRKTLLGVVSDVCLG